MTLFRILGMELPGDPRTILSVSVDESLLQRGEETEQSWLCDDMEEVFLRLDEIKRDIARRLARRGGDAVSKSGLSESA